MYDPDNGIWRWTCDICGWSFLHNAWKWPMIEHPFKCPGWGYDPEGGIQVTPSCPGVTKAVITGQLTLEEEEDGRRNV